MTGSGTTPSIRAILLWAVVRLVGPPVGIFLLLTLPRIYTAVVTTSFGEEFTPAYVALNLALALLINGASLLCAAVWPRVGQAVLVVVPLVLLVIRVVNAELLRTMGVRYSAVVFAHLELETLRVVFAEFWPAIVTLVLSLAGLAWAGWRLRLPAIPTGLWSRLVVAAYALACLGGVGVLYQFGSAWSYRAFDSYLLAIQARGYYAGAAVLDQLDWDAAERARMRQLGLEFADIDPLRPPPSWTAENLLVVYLEGFSAEWAGVGGAVEPGLTPHLDRFARENTWAERHFSTVRPTISSLVSGQCGVLSEFSNLVSSGIIGFAGRGRCLSDCCMTSATTRCSSWQFRVCSPAQRTLPGCIGMTRSSDARN